MRGIAIAYMSGSSDDTSSKLNGVRPGIEIQWVVFQSELPQGAFFSQDKVC